MTGDEGTGKPTHAQEPTPQAGQMFQLTQAQLDEMVHGKMNKQLGEHKERWTAQVAAQYQEKLAELEKFKKEIEERDLSELQKAQKTAETAQEKLRALESNLFQSRWQNAISTALHEAHVAGTSVLPQFVGGVDPTGKETPEESTAMAQQAVSTAFDNQSQALTAAGYAPRQPAPGQAPGFPPHPSTLTGGQNQIPGAVPGLSPGGPPSPGSVQAPQGGREGAWQMMKGVLAGASGKPQTPQTPGAT